ncbi:hypothetical protein PIB30_001466 [Stylosanthes scabra]|uniref:F-box domain-containing protein n=1 Tax=Stylosanthes scabra TaxID=79078 RepID=A0ABU6Q2I1_9FABA|nr:hypothetical protein [Stylosanthes scabra]
MNDVLPVELIQAILLRVPARHLFPLKLVSKLWLSLISNPEFVELHLHRNSALTPAFFFTENSEKACLVDLHALFNEDATIGAAIKDVPIPFGKKKKEKKNPTTIYFEVLGSCRGFVFLHRKPHVIVVWNPVTGSCKQICYLYSYPHIFKRDRYFFGSILYGVGYDASNDDYLVVFTLKEDRIDCFSLRKNSWMKINVEFPISLTRFDTKPKGLFLNGGIHWLCYEAILMFDVREKSLSEICLPPEQNSVGGASSNLVILDGCLALYYYEPYKTKIWVMKEYKVWSSWTLYVIRYRYFNACIRPLCLSNGGDFIGLDSKDKISKYNLEGELLQRFQYYHNDDVTNLFARYTLYTETLVTLPKKEKKWAKIRSRWRGLIAGGSFLARGQTSKENN